MRPLNPLDTNLQGTIVQPRANGIAAAQLLAVKIAAECQVLPLDKVKISALRRGKANHHCIADGLVNVGDGEGNELTHLPLSSWLGLD